MTRKLATSLILCALVYAPLAHGCVTDQTWFILDGLLAASFTVYMTGRVLQRDWPAIPAAPWIPAGLLLLLALLQTLNPMYVYDPEKQSLMHLHSHLPGLPSTIDQRTSIIALIHWAALAMGFFTLANLSRDRTTRWLLLGTIAAVGAGMAIAGMVIKIQGETVIPFTKSQSGTFFGTYVYHAHAAAFLNLCWPAALALTFRSHVAEQPLKKAIWINAFLMIFLALFINISKFGHLAAFPGLALALATMRRATPSTATASPFARVLLGSMLLGTTAFLLLPLIGQSVGRWDYVIREGFGGRPMIYSVAISIIKQHPLWGTGVGTFQLIAPYFAVSMQMTMPGRFSHAHQDYLETAVDSGLVGTLLWVVLLVWNYAKGINHLLRHPEELSLAVAMVALTIVGLHALVDFPLQIGSLRLYAAAYFAMLWRKSRPTTRPERIAVSSAKHLATTH